jgi:hypothetical protein
MKYQAFYRIQLSVFSPYSGILPADLLAMIIEGWLSRVLAQNTECMLESLG